MTTITPPTSSHQPPLILSNGEYPLIDMAELSRRNTRTIEISEDGGTLKYLKKGSPEKQTFKKGDTVLDPEELFNKFKDANQLGKLGQVEAYAGTSRVETWGEGGFPARTLPAKYTDYNIYTYSWTDAAGNGWVNAIGIDKEKRGIYISKFIYVDPNGNRHDIKTAKELINIDCATYLTDASGECAAGEGECYFDNYYGDNSWNDPKSMETPMTACIKDMEKNFAPPPLGDTTIGDLGFISGSTISTGMDNGVYTLNKNNETSSYDSIEISNNGKNLKYN